MKLKNMPSLRNKKHYITFRLYSEGKLDFNSTRDALWNSLLNWMGEGDLAKARVRIIKNLWNSREQTGFISCSPKYVDQVKLGMALVRQIGDKRAVFQTLRVSGTIKSAKEKLKIEK